MKKMLFAAVLSSLVLGAPLASAKDGPGGPGTPGASCRYCSYQPFTRTYACEVSQFGGHQGGCTIWYELGVPICEEPSGPPCAGGVPVPGPIVMF